METPRDPELYAVVCVLSLLAAVGTVGNIVVLYVFWRPARRERAVTGPTSACPSASATVYIMTLAAADLITCVLDIPSTIYMEWVVFRMYSDAFCKFHQFLIMSNIPFSAMIVVAIAVDRYVCICHPLKHATFATACKARVVVILLAGVACVLGLLGAASFGVYHAVPITHPQRADTTTPTWTTSDPSYNYQTPADPRISGIDGAEMEAEANKSACLTGSNHTDDCSWTTYIVINTGYCGQNGLVLSETFLECYVVIHSLIYPVCLLVVIVLYSFIYRSVLIRRAQRQRARASAAIALTRPPTQAIESASGNGTSDNDELKVTTVVAFQEGSSMITGTGTAAATGTGNSPDRLRLSANIRTAAMLFVVTVVFLVTFAPAFLMSVQLIPYNLVIFHIYFVNNVANPVIYSFMNNYFRRELDSMFCQFTAAPRNNFR